jgi:hypothetical protein
MSCPQNVFFPRRRKGHTMATGSGTDSYFLRNRSVDKRRRSPDDEEQKSPEETTASPVIAPQPLLSRKMKFVGPKPEKSVDKYDYGSFVYIDWWQLAKGRRGIIVQEVARSLKIQKRKKSESASWIPVDHQEIETWADPECPFYLDCMHYWEGFEVSAAAAAGTPGKQQTAIHADQFAVGAFRPSDQELAEFQYVGTYSITGLARFYPFDGEPAAFGLDGAVPLASGLPSTTNDVSAHLAWHVPQLAGVSNFVRRTIRSEWDSAVKYGNTKIEIA